MKVKRKGERKEKGKEGKDYANNQTAAPELSTPVASIQ